MIELDRDNLRARNVELDRALHLIREGGEIGMDTALSPHDRQLIFHASTVLEGLIIGQRLALDPPPIGK